MAWARLLHTDLTPLVSADYRPTEPDERGLWQQCDDLEREIASSKLLLDDAALKSYIRGMMERLLGSQPAQRRIYPMRHPQFNAARAPPGMPTRPTTAHAPAGPERRLPAVRGVDPASDSRAP